MTSLAQRLLSRLTGFGTPVDQSGSGLRVPPQLRPQGPFPVAGLPEGRYFAALGELAENYGGTSSVVLHRSKMFAEQSGNPVDILTFGHLRDYHALTEQMLDDGRFVPGVRFRNMWAELSGMHARSDSRQDFADFSPLTDSTTDKVVRGPGVPIRRFRRNEAGANLQIDLCRADGSVIVSDRRDVTVGSGKLRNSLILCDTSGRPVQEFTSVTELRNYWLDFVFGDDLAFLFSDTFGIAGFTHQYKRRNVVLVQTFHNNHLRHGAESLLDYTEKRYLPFLDNIDDFDATVVLTERQRRDLNELMGPSPQRWVVPNSRPMGTAKVGRRNLALGLCVGRLVAGKQIDHAVRAIVSANERLDNEVSLDIYGDGTARDAIEQVIAESKASSVRLLGYDPAAADHFSEASFSLLTSRSEAMPLVLAESMSRGCIPIAYDIAYGPDEIITDGVDGFLVEPDDLAALTEVIVKLQTMDPGHVEAIREAAMARAKDFSDSAITERWGELLRETLENRRVPQELTVFECETTTRLHGESLTLEVSFSSSRPLLSPRAHIVLRSRTEPVLTRVEASVDRVDSDRCVVSAALPASRISWVKRGIIDAHLEVHDESGRGSRRLPASGQLKSGEKLRLADFTVYATKHGSLSFKHD